MHFGLRPWDVEHMTLREVSEYLTQLDQATAETDN